MSIILNEGHSTKGRYVKQFCIIYHDFSVKHLIVHFR